MAIVTTGLHGYWNPKAGIDGSKMVNLAPAGVALDATIIGGTYNASTGALELDGVDDGVTIPMAAPFTTKQSFTMEYRLDPISYVSGQYYEIFSGRAVMGSWSETGWSDSYSEFYTSNTSAAYVSLNTYNLAFQSLNPLHIVYRYNASTGKVQRYVNNVFYDELTLTAGQSVSFAYASGPLNISYGQVDGSHHAFFRAFRFYTRALTDAELTQNYNEGDNLGITLIPPKVKVGEWRLGTGDVVNLYDITDHPNEKFRMPLADRIAFVPVVPVTDPNASRIRLSATEALAKS